VSSSSPVKGQIAGRHRRALESSPSAPDKRVLCSTRFVRVLAFATDSRLKSGNLDPFDPLPTLEKRIEISASVSEAVAEAFTNANDLPEEVHRVAQRDIAGARYVPRSYPRIVESLGVAA
jgi:hypothetical protein